MRFLLPLFVLASQFACGQLSESTKVHSHNDYLQNVPFWAAFDGKANSIEVDVFLRNDSLFVTHHESEIIPNKTIEALYLKPMKKAFTSDIDGKRKLQLLIDIKSEAKPTLDRLIEVLKQFHELTNNNAISLVISGNRPLPEEYVQYPEFILFDHQSLDDLKDPELWKKVAVISLPFYKYSKWEGKSAISDSDYVEIKNIVAKAHTYNKPFRFWATPDTKIAWKTLAQLGIDFINTDKPTECAAYIEKLKRVHH